MFLCSQDTTSEADTVAPSSHLVPAAGANNPWICLSLSCEQPQGAAFAVITQILQGLQAAPYPSGRQWW
jgi:hypothetical protein